MIGPYSGRLGRCSRTPYEYDVLSPYVGALDGQSSDFRGFFAWFREEEDIYNEQLARSKTNEEVAFCRDSSRCSPIPSSL
jgi:hypothetical protein